MTAEADYAGIMPLVEVFVGADFFRYFVYILVLLTRKFDLFDTNSLSPVQDQLLDFLSALREKDHALLGRVITYV